MVAEVICDQPWLPQSGQTGAPTASLAFEQTPTSEQSSQPSGVVKMWTIAAAVLLGIAFLASLGLSKSGALRSHKNDVKSVAVVIPSASPTTLAKSNTTNTTIAATAIKATPFEVIVEPNQTLAKIAIKYLGSFDQQRLKRIQALNPGLIDPDDIQPGQKIQIPDPAEEHARPPANVRNLP